MLRRLVSSAVVLAPLLFSLFVAAPVRAVMLSPGDIVVGGVTSLGPTIFALFQINPVTGDRTIISGAGIGTGPASSTTFGIALGLDGSLLVNSYSFQFQGISFLSRILRVDPSTGNRTIVSGAGDPGSPDVGNGPLMIRPNGLHLQADGRILVAASNGVFRVDPVSGDRTLVSGAGAGNGPSFSSGLVGLDQDAQGTIYVADTANNAVFTVDPSTGNRAILSDNSHGSGPLTSGPQGLLFHAHSLLVTNNTSTDLLRIDAMTGVRTIVTGSSTGAGPNFSLPGPGGLDLEESGNIVVSDNISFSSDIGKVFRVDPANGNRTVVSGNGVGNGPMLTSAYSILVVPSVPEPSSLVLASLALLGLVGWVRRAAG